MEGSDAKNIIRLGVWEVIRKIGSWDEKTSGGNTHREGFVNNKKVHKKESL